MKAPNGKPSNLTPEQWKLVRTPQFKAWFGDWENDPENASKVVDENGEPLVVYHGTNSEFYYFDKNSESNTYGTSQGFQGFFFTKSKGRSGDYALSKEDLKGGDAIVISAFLSLKNPNIKDAKNQSWVNVYPEQIDNSFDNKNDGVITYNILDGATSYSYWNNNPDDNYIAFETNQIKLADGSNTTFDGKNPDIRFAEGGMTYREYVDTQFNENEDRYLPSGYLDDFQVKQADKKKYPILFKKKNGLEYRIKNNDDSSVVVFDNENQVAYADNKAIMVAPTYQKRGIGLELVRILKERNPSHRFGSMTPEGFNLMGKYYDTYIAKNPDIRFAEGGTMNTIQQGDALIYKDSEFLDFDNVIYVEDVSESAHGTIYTLSNGQSMFETQLKKKFRKANEGEINRSNIMSKEIFSKGGKTRRYMKKIKRGGITYGKSHAEGGIPVKNQSTGDMLEVEGGEGIVNKRSMASDKKVKLNGKEMTICEAVSQLNQLEGGVQFSCDDVEDRQFIEAMARGGELERGVRTEQEHIQVLKDLYAKRITPKQASKRIAKDHLKEDSRYYSKLAKMEGKMADGGGIGREETQENNFGVSYKLGDKFILNDVMSSKKGIETSITEILPSGLFFKVDKSSNTFSIKTLHSKGSSLTRGQYLIHLSKMAKGGEIFDKETEDLLRDLTKKYAKGGEVVADKTETINMKDFEGYADQYNGRKNKFFKANDEYQLLVNEGMELKNNTTLPQDEKDKLLAELREKAREAKTTLGEKRKDFVDMREVKSPFYAPQLADGGIFTSLPKAVRVPHELKEIVKSKSEFPIDKEYQFYISKSERFPKIISKGISAKFKLVTLKEGLSTRIYFSISSKATYEKDDVGVWENVAKTLQIIPSLKNDISSISVNKIARGYDVYFFITKPLSYIDIYNITANVVQNLIDYQSFISLQKLFKVEEKTTIPPPTEKKDDWNWRFKTEQELKDEFGDDWMDTLSWSENMNFLLGEEIVENDLSRDFIDEIKNTESGYTNTFEAFGLSAKGSNPEDEYYTIPSLAITNKPLKTEKEDDWNWRFKTEDELKAELGDDIHKIKDGSVFATSMRYLLGKKINETQEAVEAIFKVNQNTYGGVEVNTQKVFGIGNPKQDIEWYISSWMITDKPLAGEEVPPTESKKEITNKDAEEELMRWAKEKVKEKNDVNISRKYHLHHLISYILLNQSRGKMSDFTQLIAMAKGSNKLEEEILRLSSEKIPIDSFVMKLLINRYSESVKDLKSQIMLFVKYESDIAQELGRIHSHIPYLAELDTFDKNYIIHIK